METFILSEKAVITKLLICVVTLILFLTVSKAVPLMYMLDDKFIEESSFLWKLVYLYISTMACKPKYYFAWTLGPTDAVNNAAGYGFNGIDENGQFRWDLISNLNIWNIEYGSQGLKESLLSSRPWEPYAPHTPYKMTGRIR
ncbi:unnamed protein product [Ranitomeya imitator]|uniref:Uncharacterized protein n=1 Tax=Ranitomeya imitator TaxID=111125 RepID=A0ABN9L456_9NEOB|nr:unnamed protein product [Ranitomeya imitator]